MGCGGSTGKVSVSAATYPPASPPRLLGHERGPETQAKKSLKTCNNGHELQLVPAWENCCDGCDKDVEYPEVVFRCNECDFDLCRQCFFPPGEEKVCTNGHELVPFVNEKPGTLNSCDSCGRSGIAPPEHVFRCAQCNFDLCRKCYFPQGEFAEPACLQKRKPKWKTQNHNEELSALNIGILEAALDDIQQKGPREDLLENVNSVIVPFYDMINAGIQCPFMSADEAMMYLAWMVEVVKRWPSDPLNFASPGLGSQCHSIAEVYTYGAIQCDSFGLQKLIKECDLMLGGKPLLEMQHEILMAYFPHWMAARMYGQGTAAGKQLLVDSVKFGLKDTQVWKEAHETMLKMLEGQMRCHYLTGTYCDVLEATMDGTCKDRPSASIFASLLTTHITVTFHHHGKRTLGSAAEHTIEGSELIWLEKGIEKCKGFDGQPVILESKGDGTTEDSELKGVLRFTFVPADPSVGFKFRFGPSGQGGGYSRAELTFDPPGTRKLPAYWEREKLEPKLCKLGQGLALKASDNIMLAILGQEHLDEARGNPDTFQARNFLYQSPISDGQIAEFQKLFDETLKKKYTRDRKGGKVPDRMVITRGYRNHNSSNWVEYSIKRGQVKAEMQTPERAALPRKIENLKTADVLPDSDSPQYELDEEVNEQFLFHGTNDKAAKGITEGDFLVTLAGSNAGTLYGKGVYLAESVSKSDEYTEENDNGERAILICRAALGCVNYNDEVSPDVDALVDSCVNGNFHCVVGDREKCRGTFREIIVYANNQVYPEYVIWYKRHYDD